MTATKSETTLITTIRLDEQALAPIKARGTEKAAVIRESLDRYFTMLDRARRNLRGQFVDSELLLLADVCNGVIFQAWSVPHLVAEIEDSLQDGYARKWGVDGPALVARLQALSLIETYALVDVIERFWFASSAGQEVQITTLLD